MDQKATDKYPTFTTEMACALRQRRIIVLSPGGKLLARIVLVTHVYDWRKNKATADIGVQLLLRDGTTGYASYRPEQLRLVNDDPLLLDIAQCG